MEVKEVIDLINNRIEMNRQQIDLLSEKMKVCSIVENHEDYHECYILQEKHYQNVMALIYLKWDIEDLLKKEQEEDV